MKFLEKILLIDVFPFLCRLVGCGLIFLAITNLSRSVANHSAITPLALLVIGIFFLLLPIAKTISLGKLLQFERDISRIKEEARETQAELRQNLSAYSSMVSAISNTINQNVNVHFHPEREAQKQAREEMLKADPIANSSNVISNKINNFVEAAGNDYNYALALLRMKLERAMRDALGRKIENHNPLEMRSSHVSARQMFKELVNLNRRFNDMHYSFDYVIKVCNAAIHGQQVSVGHAEEAIHMGLVLIEEIKKENGKK